MVLLLLLPAAVVGEQAMVQPAKACTLELEITGGG